MKLKTFIIVFILLVFAIILFQNLEKVSIQLLFWKFEMIPLFILFPLIMLIGIIIGFLLAGTRRIKQKKIKRSQETSK